MGAAHIIWDFNGTLLDDLDAAVAAVSDMLAARGGPAMTRDGYRALVEMPITRFYQKLPLLRDIPFDTLTGEFNAGYVRHSDQIVLAPGGQDVLEAARRRGVGQSILSAFEQSRIEMWLARLGIGGFFEDICGAGDLRAESKIDRARAWAQSRGIDRRRTVLVGDTNHDWETARALGVSCVLVSYGHQPEADLRACGVPVIDHLGRLPALLSGMGLWEEERA